MALQGTSFGVDFNPAADRLRIISDTGQNLRINVADGSTTVDTSLTNAGAPALGVTGAMYTNNDADPNTGTTLFDVDSTLDQVVVQSPPNNGTLVATGKLGVDTTPDVAADIYSRIKDGTTVSNSAFAALSSPSTSSFYSVDLLTGRATKTGDFQAANRPWASRCPRTSADPLPSAVLRGGPGVPPAHRAPPGTASSTTRGPRRARSLSSRVAM